MRTLRNVTFLVLCAMVYLTPAAPQAASSCSSQTWSYPGGGCQMTYYYSGNCGSCGDGYDHAVGVCGDRILVEFFCDSGTGSFTFGCCVPILD